MSDRGWEEIEVGVEEKKKKKRLAFFSSFFFNAIPTQVTPAVIDLFVQMAS